MALERIGKIPQFVVTHKGVIVLDKTGFGVGSFADFKSTIHPGCMSLEEGIESILTDVNLALEDYFKRFPLWSLVGKFI